MVTEQDKMGVKGLERIGTKKECPNERINKGERQKRPRKKNEREQRD